MKQKFGSWSPRTGFILVLFARTRIPNELPCTRCVGTTRCLETTRSVFCWTLMATTAPAIFFSSMPPARSRAGRLGIKRGAIHPTRAADAAVVLSYAGFVLVRLEPRGAAHGDERVGAGQGPGIQPVRSGKNPGVLPGRRSLVARGRWR